MSIYLDNASTTKMDKAVLDAMRRYLVSDFGNASSIHRHGVRAAVGIEEARAGIAAELECSPDEVFFTSGGTESNNFAIKGRAWSVKNTRAHFVASCIEHPSVMEPLLWLRGRGFAVDFLPVDGEGRIDPDDLAKAIRKNTILVTVGHANHEIGVIQDIAALAQICADKGVCFHTDACQSFTKAPLSTTLAPFAMVSLNAHKIHGPKGVGALIVRKGCRVGPLLHGGGQEQGMRSGTLNTAGIVGMGKALAIACDNDNDRMAFLRDRLISRINKLIDGVRLTGPRGAGRLCNHASFRVEGIRGKDLVLAMDREGVTVSAGSACSSGTEEPSHVLTAIGLSTEQALSGVRFSLSRHTTEAEIDAAADCMSVCVKRLRSGRKSRDGKSRRTGE